MSEPGDYTIRLYRGDDWDLAVTAQWEDGSAVDLTGWTAKAQIRASISSPDPLLEIPTVIAADGSQVALSLDHEQTASFQQAGGVWDLQLTDPAGRVRTPLKGSVAVTPDVTR